MVNAARWRGTADEGTIERAAVREPISDVIHDSDLATAGLFEARLGHDISAVRIHARAHLPLRGRTSKSATTTKTATAIPMVKCIMSVVAPASKMRCC